MTVIAAPLSIADPVPAALTPDARPGAPAGRVLSRPLLLVFAASLGADTALYLLLTVVPALASAGGDPGAAGLSTAALMLASVAGEVATTALVARVGQRWAFALGLVLLGLPALALLASNDVRVILAVCAIRGVGFGITVVVGGALVASLAPEGRRGEGLGLYGVVVGLPAIVAMPLGGLLARSAGDTAVLVLGAGAAIAALPAVLGMPDRPATGSDGPALGPMAALRSPAILRPSLVFAATTVAAGIVVTFLPLAVTGSADTAGSLGAAALLVQAVSATAARWGAGIFSDRHDGVRLFIPGLLLASAGMAGLMLADRPVAALGAMVLFGTGFGIAQSATMAVMLGRVSPAAFGSISAVWNLVYDAGFGLGAAGFGAAAHLAGCAPAFGLTGALMLAAMLPALLDRRASRVR